MNHMVGDLKSVYEDRVVIDGGSTLFAEKKVIIDSRQVDTLLAIPL